MIEYQIIGLNLIASKSGVGAFKSLTDLNPAYIEAVGIPGTSISTNGGAGFSVNLGDYEIKLIASE